MKFCHNFQPIFPIIKVEREKLSDHDINGTVKLLIGKSLAKKK